MPKQISDEKLLSALLVHGGVTKAAAALGISRNAVYKRLQDETFRSQYEQMQGTLLSVAAASMSDGLSDAVAALLDVIHDKGSAASVKVSAADSLLRHCCRYVETANILRRLDALENQKI